MNSKSTTRSGTLIRKTLSKKAIARQNPRTKNPKVRQLRGVQDPIGANSSNANTNPQQVVPPTAPLDPALVIGQPSNLRQDLQGPLISANHQILIPAPDPRTESLLPTLKELKHAFVMMNDNFTTVNGNFTTMNGNLKEIQECLWRMDYNSNQNFFQVNETLTKLCNKVDRIPGVKINKRDGSVSRQQSISADE